MVDRVHNYGGSSRVSTQGIKEVKTAYTTVVGGCKPLAFGKEVMYAKVGAAAIPKGRLVLCPAPIANHEAVTAASTASIGAKEVTVTLGATAVAKDLYKDGTLLIDTDGDFYMIQGHPSAAASASLKVTLKDELENSIATQVMSLIHNPGNGVVQKADSAALTSKPAGVTLVSAAASTFIYIGKQGIFPVLVEGTWVIGEDLNVGSASGSVRVKDTASISICHIGKAVATPSTTYGLCDFNL